MPIVEVHVNRQQVAIGGGNDLDLLTFSLVSLATSSQAILRVTGMKRSTDEHLQWVSLPVHKDDAISVIFKHVGTPSSPVATWHRSDLEPTANEEIPKSHTVEEGPHMTFRMQIAGNKEISALVAGKSMFQVTAEWLKTTGEYRLEVGCVGSDETNQDEMWLRSPLSFDEPLEIQLS